MSGHHDCCLCRERVGTIKYRKKRYFNDCYELFVASGGFDDPWLDHMGGGGWTEEDEVDGVLEQTGDEMWDDIRDVFAKAMMMRTGSSTSSLDRRWATSCHLARPWIVSQ